MKIKKPPVTRRRRGNHPVETHYPLALLTNKKTMYKFKKQRCKACKQLYIFFQNYVTMSILNQQSCHHSPFRLEPQFLAREMLRILKPYILDSAGVEVFRSFSNLLQTLQLAYVYTNWSFSTIVLKTERYKKSV